MKLDKAADHPCCVSTIVAGISQCSHDSEQEGPLQLGGRLAGAGERSRTVHPTNGRHGSHGCAGQIVHAIIWYLEIEIYLVTFLPVSASDVVPH